MRWRHNGFVCFEPSGSGGSATLDTESFTTAAARLSLNAKCDGAEPCVRVSVLQAGALLPRYSGQCAALFEGDRVGEGAEIVGMGGGRATTGAAGVITGAGLRAGRGSSAGAGAGAGAGSSSGPSSRASASASADSLGRKKPRNFFGAGSAAAAASAASAASSASVWFLRQAAKPPPSAKTTA